MDGASGVGRRRRALVPPHDPAEFDNEPLRPYNAGPDALLVNLASVRLTLRPSADQKTAQVIAIQEYIYQQLKNVNSALSQSKKLVYFYQYMGKIATNSNKMLDLSAQHPEYAVLVSKYYVEIGKQAVKLKQEVMQDILNEDKDFLIDAMDREMLIEKVFNRVRNINGNILYIILRLENAKKIPYLYQVPVLRNYVNIDKAIVGEIIQKYRYIFN